MTFVPATEFSVINAPILINLTLKYCDGTQYLNIVVSTGLKNLSLVCDNLNLNCFANCKRLIGLYLWVLSPLPVDERSSYEEFIFSLSKLEILVLSSFVLELLSTGVVTKRLPLTLNCLWKLQLGHVDLGQICKTSYALELIKCFPNLSELHIWVCCVDNAATVLKYLDALACLDQPLNMLKNVVVQMSKGSKAELFFVKLLFACTPSLVRMNIKPERAFDSKEEMNITTELMHFPRASPKAELFYTPKSVQEI